MTMDHLVALVDLVVLILILVVVVIGVAEIFRQVRATHRRLVDSAEITVEELAVLKQIMREDNLRIMKASLSRIVQEICESRGVPLP
jgi:hypothetical protein